MRTWSSLRKAFLVFILVGVLCGCTSADRDIWRADRFSGSSRKASDAAIFLYQRALKKLPSGRARESVLLKLGELYMSRGDYPKAIEQFKEADSPQAKELLAQAYFKDSDFTAALEVFNKIGEKGDAEHLYYYGLALEKSNLYDHALRLYSLIKDSPAYEAKAKERASAINLIAAKTAYAGIDEEVKRAIQASPGPEDFREASALYLLMDEDITLTDDNRLVSEFHYVTKILNDRGKERFGEVSLTYDSTYEKLEVDYARTIKPDGTVVTVGDKNIRDVSLYLNYPLYSNARARIISMPEVAAGAVIEYKGRVVRSKLPNLKDFNTSYWLAADEPILLQRCAISVPKDKKLKYKIVNAAYNILGFDMKPKVRQEAGRKVFTLEFKDVPQIIPEPGMPPLSRVNPYILFSTFESWKDIYTWWRQLYKDKTTPDEDIRAKAAQLIKDKKTQEEKARALYNFCAQEVRYVAVEYGDAGYEPHKASEIFKNKYGDCKDKAILLISMLEAAGIEAFPVLISTLDSFEVEEDVPSLLFNHAIAAIALDDKLLFMDATGNTVTFGDLPTGDQDRLTLVFFKDKYELIKTPLFAPEHNGTSVQMQIKVHPDETIEVHRRIDTRGAYQQGQRYWLKFTMPVLVEESLKQRARSIADSAVLKSYKIENVDDLDKPVLLEFSFTAPQYFIKAGKARIMDQLSGVDDSIVVKESRTYPIEFPWQDTQEETIEVELPDHLAVKYLPEPVEARTKWFVFTSRYEVRDRLFLRFTWSQKMNERVIPVAEYGAYKKAVEDLVPLVNQQVVLEEVK